MDKQPLELVLQAVVAIFADSIFKRYTLMLTDISKGLLVFYVSILVLRQIQDAATCYSMYVFSLINRENRQPSDILCKNHRRFGLRYISFRQAIDYICHWRQNYTEKTDSPRFGSAQLTIFLQRKTIAS